MKNLIHEKYIKIYFGFLIVVNYVKSVRTSISFVICIRSARAETAVPLSQTYFPATELTFALPQILKLHHEFTKVNITYNIASVIPVSEVAL